MHLLVFLPTFHSHPELFYYAKKNKSSPLVCLSCQPVPTLFEVHARLSSSVSCYPVGFMRSQVKKTNGETETEREEREKGTEECWERECNTSNSQRQLSFPWQRGCHRNSSAKDAISREPKENVTQHLYGAHSERTHKLIHSCLLHTLIPTFTSTQKIYTCTHSHSPPTPQLKNLCTYCCHFPTAHTGAPTNADTY